MVTSLALLALMISLTAAQGDDVDDTWGAESTQPPQNSICSNGFIYKICGTYCPLTCLHQHAPPPICPALCKEGCFCPDGMAEHEGACYFPHECPVAGNATTTTTSKVSTLPTQQPHPPSPPLSCPEGMTYWDCAHTFPPTCEDPWPALGGLEGCESGCYCPQGMVEHQGSCYYPEDCPIASPTPPTEVPSPLPTCPYGMVYETCGTPCPLTCINRNELSGPCLDICVPGCFCPRGMAEHEGLCYHPEKCPATYAPPLHPTQVSPPSRPTCSNGMEYEACGTACPLTCENRDELPGLCPQVCVPGCFCPRGMAAHHGACYDPADCPVTTVNPCLYCRDDQVCDVVDNSPHCRDPPYVSCQSDAFLACDSEWTYCLQQNKTGRGSCVASCLSRNGNCPSDTTCITTVTQHATTLRCLELDDLPADCPAGQVMNECGDHCQETCEQRVAGVPVSCIEICGPPACTCPLGLVLFRDRCVDPRLCYTLLRYPPIIQPLPLVDSHSILLSLHSNSVNQAQFRNEEFRTIFLESIESALGLDYVEAQLHGVYNDSQGIQIVILISGPDIDASSAQSLANALRQNVQVLPFNIQQVQPVEVEYVKQDESLSLSLGAIIGIAVSSAVAGLTAVLVWVAVVCCCCVSKRRARKLSSTPLTERSENIYQLDDKIDLVDDNEEGPLQII